MPAALAFLILIASTNYLIIFFSCHGLHNYGAWLNKYHKADLWLHRVLVSIAAQLQVYVYLLPPSNIFCANCILQSFSCKIYPTYVSVFKYFLLSLLQVQNGVAIYATWTTIASLVNLNIVLTNDANMSQADAATVSLSILTVVVVVW